MKLGGQAEKCIEAGYERSDAGFVAIYGPDRKLAAQSFWYVHPDFPDTLVLDNIETNEGRDVSKLLSVYKYALHEYLDRHPETSVTRVTVGTGYSDVSLRELSKVDAPVPPLDNKIYTDAKQQRELLNLS